MRQSKIQFDSSAGRSKRFKTARQLGALWLVIVAMLLIVAPRGWAQDNATITGNVADNTGAMLPGAAVALTNTGTGQTRETTTNSVGSFRFGNIGVGTYTLTATATGFQKFVRAGIVVNVAQSLEENVALTVGSQSQTVTVEADALQVQTETSEISTLISGEQVRQLATNGRNVVQLAALGAGVSSTLPSFGGIDALTSSNAISFNGQRQTHNVYLLDGAEQNDRGCGGCFMNLPSQDAIGEFQTLGSNYSADYGLGSGGTIVMVLKSGARQYHGELYEFNRNTAYNANDFFLKRKPTNNARPAFQLNEPGGNIGGPLWIPHIYNNSRNRTFFFWNEEWRRLIQGSSPSVSNAFYPQNFPKAGQAFNYTPQSSVVAVVPNLPNNTAFNALLAGDGLTPGAAAGTPGGFTKNADGTYLIPANLMDQNAVAFLNAGTFPKANTTPNAAGTLTQYIISVKQPEFIREDAVRIDHSINSKFQLMGHYLHDAMQKTFFPPLWGTSYATVGTVMQNPSYTAVIKLTQTYSASLLNETGFYYGGNKIHLTPVAAPGYVFAQPTGYSAQTFFPLANNRLSRLPRVTLAGVLGGQWDASYFPWKNGYEGFQYKDDLSWTKGRHQFKFGVSWLHDYKNQELQANTNGGANFSNNSFSGDSIVNLMLGMADSFTQLEFLYGKNWVNNNYSGYGIDNWHVSPRLTLNLGLRYDGMPHAFERYNKFANFVPSAYVTPTSPVVLSNGTIDPAQLSTFAATGSEKFYLNGIKEAGVGGFPRGNVENRYYTFQPRIGFTYDLSGTGKTVIRGGAGVFYERVQGNDVYNAALNPPFAYQPSATNVSFSNPKIDLNTGTAPTQAVAFPSQMTTIKYNYPPEGTGNWSLGIQDQLMPSVIAAVQYVGSVGWDQNNDRQINTLPLQTNGSYATRQLVAGKTPDPTDPTGKKLLPAANSNLYRQYPGYNNINQEEQETNTNYHSLQGTIRFENKWGLTTQLAYTWSHLIDDVTNDLGGLPNPFNTRYARGSGGFDRRHIFNASYVYTLPFFKHSSNMAAKSVLGGWGISGITVAESGVPVNVSFSTDTLGLGGGTSNRPDRISKVSFPHTQTAWFDKTAYAAPLAPWAGGAGQGFGAAGKDNVVGPHLINFNLALTKTFQLTSHEGTNIELRFESFNTFNHTQFSGLDAAFTDGNFGQVTSIYTPRNLEFGGKFHF